MTSLRDSGVLKFHFSTGAFTNWGTSVIWSFTAAEPEHSPKVMDTVAFQHSFELSAERRIPIK